MYQNMFLSDLFIFNAIRDHKSYELYMPIEWLNEIFKIDLRLKSTIKVGLLLVQFLTYLSKPIVDVYWYVKVLTNPCLMYAGTLNSHFNFG